MDWNETRRFLAPCFPEEVQTEMDMLLPGELREIRIRAERPTGDKAVRAEPLSVQVEAGNVYLVEGPWNKDYMDEVKVFPHGKYKDQVDGSSGAFNKLALGGRGFFG